MPDMNESGSSNVDENSRAEGNRLKRRRKNGRRDQSFAALDLGTNNCRLLVARPMGDSFKVIDSYSRIVRLGQGLEATGHLSQDSMDAAVEAISVCARKIKTKKAKRWRCVATQACRQAVNGETFLARVKSETGLTLEIISPRVESRLAVMGCLNLIDVAKDVVLVVDIGGGSTELSWVDVRRFSTQRERRRIHRPPISAWASLPVGVVTLSERVPEHEDRAAWYADMKNIVREAIVASGADTRFTKTFKQGRGHIIGTSGTITSLAGIHLKLPYYQRDKVDGIWVPTRSIVDIARDMGGRSWKERAFEPCIGDDRAKLLVAGCAITDVICEMWPSDNIRVADRGLREGILMGLMQKSQSVGSVSEPAE